MSRYRIAIVGQSGGAGLLSTGEMLADALQDMGYNIVTDREYQSLIKGGYARFTLNFSSEPIFAVSKEVDIMVAVDLHGLSAYFDKLKPGGILIHGYDRRGVKKIEDTLQELGTKIIKVKGRELAESKGGSHLMVNVILLGILWKVLGLPYQVVVDAVTRKFKNKPKLLEIDLLCLEAGYEYAEKLMDVEKTEKNKNTELLHNAHQALSLGAIHAGCRAYYAYPMSPSSNILTYMDKWKEETGMIVKQVEDEISVAQMLIGSSFVGTRAMAATSGGGLDLMAESISLAGIIESPMVLVVAQRPGPGTGLPTWTAQGDLQIAINSGHGEFARAVIAPSHPTDAFELIQHAFNLSEEFQIPVVVLTEKMIAESLWTIPKYEQNTIAIKRGLVDDETELSELKSHDRYRITESGVSKRWLPGASDTYYFANGDEHLENGELTEEAEPSAAMYAKRNHKLEAMLAIMPDPEIYGPKDADISFVGFGSSLNVMKDAINAANKDGISVNYLHFSFVYPLKTELLAQFISDNKNVHTIENNYSGQFERLIKQNLPVTFAGCLRKWDGRPFFIDEVNQYIKDNK